MKKCRLCSSENISKNVGTVSGIWIDTRNVFFCRNCDAYFLEKNPSIDELNEYYKNEYYPTGKLFDFVKMVFRRGRVINQFNYITECLKDKNSIKKVLEVGAGDGMLLGKFKDIGCHVNGLEISSKYMRSCRVRYGFDLKNSDFLNESESYDLIIMSHVIEHFNDVNEAISKIKSILNPGGYCFIEVPNSPLPESHSRDYLNKYFKTTHTFNFTTKSIVSAFERNGFKLLDVSRICYSIDEIGYDNVAQQLMGAKSLKLRNSFDIIKYIIKLVLNPSACFKKINTESKYIGYGDNIRILIKH